MTNECGSLDSLRSPGMTRKQQVLRLGLKPSLRMTRGSGGNAGPSVPPRCGGSGRDDKRVWVPRLAPLVRDHSSKKVTSCKVGPSTALPSVSSFRMTRNKEVALFGMTILSRERRPRPSSPYRKRNAIRMGAQVYFCSTQTPSFWPSVVNSLIQSFEASSFFCA